MKRFIALIVCVSLIFGTNITSFAGQDTVDTTFDFSAFEKYGAYIYASDTGDVMKGINILSYDDSKSYDNRLYHYVGDKAYIAENTSDTDLSGAYSKLTYANSNSVEYEYLTRRQDGAWMYKTIAGKDAFFTVKNIRNRDGGSMKCVGCMYFNLTDDLIDEIDNNVTFIVEYYDTGIGDITFNYCNTGFENDGNYSTSAFKITTTGTNTWKTKVVSVTDAKMDKDWSKTALGNGTASIKVQGNSNEYYISKLMIIPTDTYNNIINPPTDDELNMDKHNDGVNWWNIAKTKGTYLDASGVASGMSAYQANISRGESIDGITKDAFETSGSLCFSVDGEKITDNDLYIVIEYLDYDANMGVTQNSNGTFGFSNQSKISVNVAKKSGSNMLLPWFNRHNTNTWKTVAIPVDDALVCASNTNTGLGDGKQDIRINANGVKTLISRIGVVKKSDIPASSHIYYEPENIAEGPTLWIAGDSLSESVDKADSYPREGWAMEFGNFFIKETISDAGSYYYDSDGNRTVTKVNNGVTVINLARGGKSTRSFLNQQDPTIGPDATDTRWDEIKQNAKRGDYLFVSFCINDVGNRTTVQTNPYLVGDAGDRFSHRANIKEFKTECDKLGINLVLVTPAVGRGLGDGQDAHIASLHSQGAELGVPVLDMRTYHKELVQALKAGSNQSEYPHDKSKLIFNHILDSDINAEYNAAALGTQDNTHVNQRGAIEISKIIVSEIKRKSDSFESMKKLSEWIDASKDIATMDVPKHQTNGMNFQVSDVKYIVDGEEKDNYQKGNVSVKINVNNNGNSATDAVVYLALYDGDGNLKKSVMSDKVNVEPKGTSQIITPEITVPELDGYTLCKYVWTDSMKPLKDSRITLFAQGWNRKATLEWRIEREYGDVNYEVYRDNLHIATVAGGGYSDTGVERGEHIYQINVVDKSGNIIDQSPCASVTVTNLYEVKQNKNVFYAKAHIPSTGKKQDMDGGIYVVDGNQVYFAKDAKIGLSLTDEQIKESYGTGTNKFMGAPLVTTGGDYSHKTVKVKDIYGVEKTAWMAATMYRPTTGANTEGMLYVDESNVSNFSDTNEKIVIFIEFLANRNAPSIQYWGKTVGDDGTVTPELKTTEAKYFSGVTGDWRNARYEITDAYFTETTSMKNNSMFRIRSGKDKPLYVSSIVVVKGNETYGQKVMNNFTNLEFREASYMSMGNKYPDGVSIDFSSGTPVKCGMDICYKETGTSDNTGEVAIADDGVGYYGTKQVILDNGALKGTYLYFKADPTYIWGASDKLKVDITYKADYDTDLVVTMPTYDKKKQFADINSQSLVVKKLCKNLEDNWQDASFIIDNASALYLDNYGALFRMNIMQSRAEPEKQLRISKIRITNMSGSDVCITNSVASDKPKIYVAGDSIAAYYRPDKIEASDIMGWGQTIGDYLDGIDVINKAVPGSCTQDFGHMESITDNAKKGDYVLIFFGHNDQRTDKWVEIEDYKATFAKWIDAIREKQAVPVLITMIPQGKVSTKALYDRDTYKQRRKAVIEVAQSKDVTLVQLGEKMLKDEANGVITGEDIVSMYCDEGGDNRTHITPIGARYVAGIIVDSMKQQLPHFSTYVKNK